MPRRVIYGVSESSSRTRAGFLRMAHRPARGQGVAFAVGGVGPIVPRILAVIALVVEIAVVARPPRRIAQAVRAHAVQTVVALVGLKAAFGDSHADDRIRIDAEPRHALDVGLHVGLADQRRAHAERAQIIAHGHLADLERETVPRRAMRLHIAARIGAHARGAADRRLHIGAGETHAARRQRIDVRGFEPRMAVAGQIVPAQLVAHDEKDIFGFFRHEARRSRVALQDAGRLSTLAHHFRRHEIEPCQTGLGRLHCPR